MINLFCLNFWFKDFIWPGKAIILAFASLQDPSQLVGYFPAVVMQSSLNSNRKLHSPLLRH